MTINIAKELKNSIKNYIVTELNDGTITIGNGTRRIYAIVEKNGMVRVPGNYRMFDVKNDWWTMRAMVNYIECEIRMNKFWH